MKISLRMFMILFLISLASPSLQAATETRPALIKVGISSQQDLFKLLSLGLDVIEVKPNEYARVLVTDQDLVTISEAGFGYSVVYPDMVAHLQAGLSGQMDMGGYHTLDEIYAALDSIYNEHPNIVTVKDSIGPPIQE